MNVQLLFFPPHTARGHTRKIWSTPIKLTGGRSYSCQSARGPCTFTDWTYYDDAPFVWQDWMADEITIPNWQGTVGYGVMAAVLRSEGLLELDISSDPGVFQGPLTADSYVVASGWGGNALCAKSCLVEN